MAYNIRTPSGRSYTAHKIAEQLGVGQATEDKILTVLNDLREEFGLKALDERILDKLESYTEYLRDRLFDGDLTAGTVTGYVSALNGILRALGLDEHTVSSKELGATKEWVGNNTELKTVSHETIDKFQEYLTEQAELKPERAEHFEALNHSVELQEQFGLRWRESVSIKLDTIERALENGILEISKIDGTKNSKEREIEIHTSEQIKALENAKNFMEQNGWRSLIDPDFTRKQWCSFSYNTLKNFKIITGEQLKFHSIRHTYAIERYEELKNNGLDEHQARMQVSEELGHSRIDITYAYVPK